MLDNKKETVETTCPKCGNLKGINDIECAHCGIIFEKYKKIQKKIAEKNKKKEEHRLEKEKIKIKEKIRNILSPSPIKIISVLLIIALSIFGFNFYKKNKQENDYEKNLRLANAVIALSTIKCIEMCEKYLTVWREAIEDKYNSDFNDDIREQMSRFILYGHIKEINQSKELAESLLQKLNQPPDLYFEAHKKIVALYGVYSQIHSLAQSPSGSLMSYNKQVNDLQSNFIKIINELKVLLPKEKE